MKKVRLCCAGNCNIWDSCQHGRIHFFEHGKVHNKKLTDCRGEGCPNELIFKVPDRVYRALKEREKED